MPGHRKPIPEELKRKLVALVREGRTPEELAQAIRNWIAQADVTRRPAAAPRHHVITTFPTHSAPHSEIMSAYIHEVRDHARHQAWPL